MKKVLLTFAFAFATFLVQAQEGEIIYTEFEPDTVAHFTVNTGIPNLPLALDVNQDGESDFIFTPSPMPNLMITTVLNSQSSWWFRLPYAIYHPDNDALPIYGDTIQVGDTIPNIESSWGFIYRFQYNRYGIPYQQVCPDPDSHYFISVRKEVNGGYCYGWIDCHIFISEDPVVNGTYHGQEIYITIYRMAYCTIHNYPLRVGQTSFDWAVPENNVTHSVTVHPNPTNGTVTITGLNLRQAEVVNTLGQSVASVLGEGDQLSVDISNLPAGIYFVNVTDEEGRKCVSKVLKE